MKNDKKGLLNGGPCLLENKLKSGGQATCSPFIFYYIIFYDFLCKIMFDFTRRKIRKNEVENRETFDMHKIQMRPKGASFGAHRALNEKGGMTACMTIFL